MTAGIDRTRPTQAGGKGPLTAPPTKDSHRRAGHQWRGRVVVVTVVCLLVALTAALLGVVAGSSSLTVADVVRTLLGGGTRAENLIVIDLRLPRVAGGLLVGLALGLAGALTQTFARNPLATPDIIGVTSGASLGAVSAIVLAGGGYSVAAGLLTLGLPLVATLGALATAAVVYGLSWRGGVDSYRLILIGIGATATLTGITSYLIAKAQITDAAAAAQWLVGSLSGISWASVWPVLIVLVVVTPIALLQSKNLEISQLGDDVSTGLGMAIQRHRLIVIVCAVLLTAAAVSASGPIEFVAFVAPQIARRLARTGRPPLVASGIVGAIIVVGGDALARGVLPGEVPVGIITAVVGAPYLIWLLTRRTTKELPVSAPSLLRPTPLSTAVAPPALEARNVTLAYERSAVFEGLDLRIEPGQVTTLVGANGSGKSTLLKAFGRLLTPSTGTVELDGRPIRSLSTRDVARRLAILPQKPLTPSATTVRDLVSRGRHPHQSLLRPWTSEDRTAVEGALAATGLAGLEERDAGSLSGGQLQRAWIALILAQEAQTILLDEPTTFLDLSHQLDVLRLVRRINRERAATVVMVLHDLSLAGRYSDRLVVVGGGRVIADGTPWEVLTPAILRDAFDLEALVIPDPSSGSPLVVPIDTDHGSTKE